MKSLSVALFSLLVFAAGCQTPSSPAVAKPASDPRPASPTAPSIPRSVYHDKLLGLLIGSAIGDAMGAPTEMWRRSDIQFDYGFVDELDDMVRTPSAEGTWQNNLPAGGTTDDTRWKALTIDFLLTQSPGTSDPVAFADFIVDRYEQRIAALKATEGFHPKPYEDNLMKMAWLQEWALVAQPYAANDLPAYSVALQKFYGGEMSCAGMLYSPMIGAVYPADPNSAYQLAFDLGIFDLGYARDMTGLVSAMTAAAFDVDATPSSIVGVNRSVDPEHYFTSRLVGRSAYRYYQHARRIATAARAVELDPAALPPEIPVAFQHLDALSYAQLRHAFDQLDEANQDVAFHPAEVYLITLTAILYTDFEFTETMTFITNYGRDNDTVAAIAGAILGAYWGAEKLPADMSQQVLTVSRDLLGIDLEQLAEQMTAWIYGSDR